MNKIKTLKIYNFCTLLVVIFLALTSCDTMQAEREYNKRSWEIKKMRLELEYLKDLHEYKKELEFKEKISDIDSIIQNYR